MEYRLERGRLALRLRRAGCQAGDGGWSDGTWRRGAMDNDWIVRASACGVGGRLLRPEGRTERASRLEALSPLRVLERGYALVYGPDGALLRSPAGVNSGDLVTARLASGSLRASVVSTDDTAETLPKG